ncbi:hypothetical protein [Streptomyces sp. SID1034]|uniref:SCO6745 family protein n=1 Tax=Streptomyces sp. SID1034 TaxID=2690248 RepID=UPI00136F6DC0|nr:hypothetical protein [Streptomyces sp. SID1034]MYV89244.1 hypothetical protein [Streptomyces sp. SID1034]
MTSLPRLGRRCHDSLNPLHSQIYFAPEAEREFTAVGLEPGRMSYFAGRAAAMGSVGAGVVAATFYNFSPTLVARHLPRAWELASPEAVLGARLATADASLRRLLGEGIADDPDVAAAAELAATAAEACGVSGRPLYASHAALPRPERPHLALWHSITLLREHRGDGHLVALAAAELDGLEALVSHTATGNGFTVEFACASRGWSKADWEAAQARLADRGLLDAEGALTPRGVELRREVEEMTDRLAAAPYAHLGEPGIERLTEIGGRLTGQALSAGAFPPGVFVRR